MLAIENMDYRLYPAVIDILLKHLHLREIRKGFFQPWSLLEDPYIRRIACRIALIAGPP